MKVNVDKNLKKIILIVLFYVLVFSLLEYLTSCGSWKVKHSIEIEKHKKK
jgi:hypothetical protein